MATEIPDVIIILGFTLLPDAEARMNLLTYGDGSCRVYPKDQIVLGINGPLHYFGITGPLRYFEYPQEAVKHLAELSARGVLAMDQEPVQVHAKNARRALGITLPSVNVPSANAP